MREWDEGVRALQARIGYEFVDVDLLPRALTHASWCNEHGGTHNERLEFLGDAIVGAVVVHTLFTQFPAADEGVLSMQKTQLVRTETLAAIGRELGLPLLLRVGAGARKRNVHQNRAKIEDATEALIGAIFLDSDFETTARVAGAWFEPHFDRLALARPKGSEAYKDPVMRLYEAVDRPPVRATAHVVVLERTGDAHEPSFRVGWWVGGLMLSEAWGPSKKRARRAAAEAALIELEAQVQAGWRPDPDAKPPKGVR